MSTAAMMCQMQMQGVGKLLGERDLSYARWAPNGSWMTSLSARLSCGLCWYIRIIPQAHDSSATSPAAVSVLIELQYS